MAIYFVMALAALSAISLSSTRMVLALYALEVGAQPVTIGILAATFSVFPLLLAVPAGKLADRFGSRWPLMFTGLGGALGLLLPYSAPALPAIFAAAGLMGLADGIYDVLLQNLAGLLSNPQNRSRNFNNYTMCRSVANFAGPLIAGFSIDHSGHAATCLYIALLTLVPVAMVLSRRDALRGNVRRAAHAGGGIRTLLSEPGVRRVLATSSLQNAGKDLYQIYMPVYTHAIGLSASTIGIVLSMNAAAMFFVRLFLPGMITKFKEEKILALAFSVGAASLVLIPFFTSAAILALISFIFGLGMGCSGPIVMMLMFSGSAEGRSGEAMGLRMSATHLTRLVGPVVFGSIGSAFGLPPMFWINALMLAAGGWLSRRR